MAAFQKLDGFVEHVAEGLHDLGSCQLRVALSNVAPDVDGTDVTTGNCFIGNVTEIDYTHLGLRDVTRTSSGQASGLYALTAADLTITATGGTVGPFQYIYIYDVDTGGLIGFWNYGLPQSILDGQEFDIEFTSGSVIVEIN